MLARRCGGQHHPQAGFRGAVVGRAGAVRSLGVDAEPHDVLPDGVLDAISLPAERTEMAALPAGVHWDRILFCAKEATYKAWFPLTKRWLGFEDAHITFTVDDSGSAGAFESTILIDGDTLSGPPLSTLAGRWSVDRELVLDGDHAMNPGLVIVDKPAGMTSHDVVGRCRRIFGTRRVGHAGTLDPMATGVLVIGIERATKILGLVTETSKSYAATIRLGQSTSTEDAEGDITQQVSAQAVTDDAIESAIAAIARRHRAGPVGGQRDQSRRPARLSAGPRRPHRRTGRPAGAHRPVRDAGGAPP